MTNERGLPGSKARMACASLALCALAACVDGPVPDGTPLPLTRLTVDRTYLRDGYGRYIFFHGVNAGCDSKLPAAVDASGMATYVGRPFPLAQADAEFARLRAGGFNSIRLLVIWEGVEPQYGQYDAGYLNYLHEIVRLAGTYGIHVLVDMHQDMFSRHLTVNYDDSPDQNAATPGTVEYQLLALVPSLQHGYTAAVQGDGAPRWVVQACLQEKKMDSPAWGIPRILGQLTEQNVTDLVNLWLRLSNSQSQTSQPIPPWAVAFATALDTLPKFDVDESTDLLPFTNWGLAEAFSLDAARCYACLLAGATAFPNLTVTVGTSPTNVQEYLQGAYANAWAQVAAALKGLPNVMGYDLMNEPSGNFIVLTAVAGMITAGAIDGAKTVLTSLLGDTNGPDVYNALVTLHLLPPDTNPDTLKKWGLDQLNAGALLGLNYGFDENFLRPFYERTANAILAADPQALFFIESSSNISLLAGSNALGSMWDITMTHPQGANLAQRVVYAPHYYTDIYPFFGFDVDPRQFTEEEVQYRDYLPDIQQTAALAQNSLGNIPVVFGEFGTYFNFNNTIENGQYVNNSASEKYMVSAAILNNYYKAFESGFQSNILWCSSIHNDPQQGDGWNHEDFSILGPGEISRAQSAWSRPYARALSGKPISTYFNSDLHYFDPDKGVPNAVHEFEVQYASKETESPTEIVVPASEYPDGFYVWISDGVCYFDPSTSTLYHHPRSDAPGFVNFVRIRPPMPGEENVGWNYFFRGNAMAGEGQ